MVKILCLGNEFLEIDNMAKKIGELLSKNFEIINVKDSFQLMTLLNEEENLVLIDVVANLDFVKEISVDQLRNDSILSAHDFDANFVLQLLGKDKKLKIIGIPQSGNLEDIHKEVLEMLKAN